LRELAPCEARPPAARAVVVTSREELMSSSFRRRRSAPVAIFLALLACLALAACGGSSSQGTSGVSKGSSTQGTGGGSSPHAGDGSKSSRASALGSLSEVAQNKVYDQALSKFATCLRAHGIDVPKPKVGRDGSARLPTPGIDRSSAKFKSAAASCGKILDESLRIAAGKAYAKGKSGG
jgi:hypothetical protein